MALISLIITTKNEESNIVSCLESVYDQSTLREEIEIFIVDNFSTDNTLEQIEKFKLDHLDLRMIIFEAGPERSAQRNFAAEKCTGEYILYLDADMALSRNVVQECAQRMADDNNLVGLYIPEEIVGSGFWIKVRNFERSFYSRTVIDGLRFIRKDKFLEAGKFDENLYACEDWDLDKRLKKLGKTDITLAPLYHNEKSFNLKKYLAKKEYYAKNFDHYINKWGRNDPDIRKQFGFYYRFIGVFTEKGKWKKIIAHPIIFIGVLWLRFMVGLNYYRRNRL